MPQDAFQLIMPRSRRSGLVFASPHSGRRYPPEFLAQSRLDPVTIRSSEDAFVDQLFEAAPRFGAPLLKALLPRAYIDLNRAADELDPALIRGVRRATANPRISSGLGVIPRVVANGRAIYEGRISRAEAERRLARAWHPYHACLQGLLEESRRMFGEAVLIDCHSMPHEAITHFGRGGRCPDVVLGDRFGAAASEEVVSRVQRAFENAGLKVVRNAPFAGAFTAQHYGRPSRRQHVVQVEIDRALYMDEAGIRPNAHFGELKALITQVIAEITALSGGARRLAAE